MKRSAAGPVGLVLAVVTVLVGLLVGMPGSPAAGAAGSSSAAPYCAIRWGSLAKVSTAPGTASPLTDLRAGRHTCYDRLVLDVAGPGGGYTVRYVDQLVQDGSGAVVTVDGGARLEVVATVAGQDADGDPTYAPADRLHAVDVAGFRTLRQVAYLGSYEGYTQVGVGVRARLPFRVLELQGPGAGHRIILDVAHRW